MDKLLKESWKNNKGPIMPTTKTLMATYERPKAEFEEIVAIQEQYFPGKAMAPRGMGSPDELHKVKIMAYHSCGF